MTGLGDDSATLQAMIDAGDTIGPGSYTANGLEAEDTTVTGTP